MLYTKLLRASSYFWGHKQAEATSMIRSMTGFGKATAEGNGWKFTAEVRTLNGKQADINLRIPSGLREFEARIRAEASRMLDRGKIDITITAEQATAAGYQGIDLATASQYLDDIRALASHTKLPLPDSLLSTLLTMPSVMRTHEMNLAETEQELLQKVVMDALEKTDQFRLDEGKALEAHLKGHNQMIQQLLAEIAPFESARIQNLRTRFNKNKNEFLLNEPASAAFDENRFEQEVFWYIEKLDITEEKNRLAGHGAYFVQTLSATDNQGRKLSFIAQEMGREINTIGSKASDLDIQRIVVQMKDELEKIKEQLNNIL